MSMSMSMSMLMSISVYVCINIYVHIHTGKNLSIARSFEALFLLLLGGFTALGFDLHSDLKIPSRF